MLSTQSYSETYGLNEAWETVGKRVESLWDNQTFYWGLIPETVFSHLLYCLSLIEIFVPDMKKPHLSVFTCAGYVLFEWVDVLHWRTLFLSLGWFGGQNSAGLSFPAGSSSCPVYEKAWSCLFEYLFKLLCFVVEKPKPAECSYLLWHWVRSIFRNWRYNFASNQLKTCILLCTKVIWWSHDVQVWLSRKGPDLCCGSAL